MFRIAVFYKNLPENFNCNLAKHDFQENVSDTFLQISHKTNIKNNKFSKDHFYKEVRKRRPSRGLQISQQEYQIQQELQAVEKICWQIFVKKYFSKKEILKTACRNRSQIAKKKQEFSLQQQKQIQEKKERNRFVKFVILAILAIVVALSFWITRKTLITFESFVKFVDFLRPFYAFPLKSKVSLKL